MQAQTTAPRISGEATPANLAERKTGSKKAVHGRDGSSRHEASTAKAHGGKRPGEGRDDDPSVVAGQGKPESLFAAFLAKAKAPGKAGATGEAGSTLEKSGEIQAAEGKAGAKEGLSLGPDAKGKAALSALGPRGLHAEAGKSSGARRGLEASAGGERVDGTGGVDGDEGRKKAKVAAELPSGGNDALGAAAGHAGTIGDNKGADSDAKAAGKTDAVGSGDTVDAALAGASDGKDGASLLSAALGRQATGGEGEGSGSKQGRPEGGKREKDSSDDGDSPRVSVADLRRNDRYSHEAVPAGQSAQAEQASALRPEDRTAEIDLDLGSGNAIGQGGGREWQSGTQRADQLQAPRDFSQLLADRLRDSWNGDIVQSAQVVLRDGDSGTIRLRLHPDNLGGVKIELQVADNNISGKIIVESDEAKSAFERNMAQLHDAFRQGGFESARLDVQIGAGAGGFAGGQGGAEGSGQPFWSERRGLESLARAVPETGIAAQAARGRGGVDILA